MVEYHRRFLCWWGLLLFGLGLGSRRSADNDLRDLECAILHNLNLLADTQQDSLPVTKTLDHFIGHVGSSAFAQLLHQHTQRLIRMKALAWTISVSRATSSPPWTAPVTSASVTTIVPNA